MRWLSLLVLCAAPAFATQPTCTPGTSGGTTLVCPNISYDATIPSGQTYARWIAFVVYPQGQQASASLCIAVIGPGKGWVESAAAIYTIQATYARALALVTNTNCPGGYAVYAFYTTWAAAAQITNSPSAGSNVTITIEAVNNSSGNTWWPNLTPGTLGACQVDSGCLGYTVPFTAILGSQASGFQETVSVTSQSGTGTTNVIATLAHNHSAGEIIYLPKTQMPAPVADAAAYTNWLGNNAGQGTYPGDPQKIYLVQISSDSHVGLMVRLLPHGECLFSCSILTSWWGSSVGNNGGSSQTLSSWKILGTFPIGVPWDLNYEYANGTSGMGVAVQAAVIGLVGCKPGVETGCTAAATADSPIAYTATTTDRGPIASATGAGDDTTPCEDAPQTFPNVCSPNNQYAKSGRDYILFGGGGSGHGCDINNIQTTQSFTGVETAGSSTILVSNTSGLISQGAAAGMTVSGPGMPFDAEINSITTNTSILLGLSKVATLTGTFTLTGQGQCFPYIQGLLAGGSSSGVNVSGTAGMSGTAGLQ